MDPGAEAFLWIADQFRLGELITEQPPSLCYLMLGKNDGLPGGPALPLESMEDALPTGVPPGPGANQAAEVWHQLLHRRPRMLEWENCRPVAGYE